MSDITRNDLRAWKFKQGPFGHGQRRYEKVSDEEFDRLAREAGFVKADDSILTTLSGCERSGLTRIRAEALRALLTDECDECGGAGAFGPLPDGGPDEPCRACDGRGWLPKDGVGFFDDEFGEDKEVLCIAVDWLEADDT